MKNKNTIITILVLVMLWFVGQQFFFNKNVEAPVVNDKRVAEEISDTVTDESMMVDDEVEVLPENADFETLAGELEDLNADEEVLDGELGELDTYSF